MYDVVMSLGYNCEISFRLEDYFGRINAMPFSWSYVMKREEFPSILENIDNLFNGEVQLINDHMIQCLNCNIKYHPRYEILLREGKPTAKSIEEAILELRDRVQHLKAKFKELLCSDKNTLFLIKVENKDEADNIAYIQNIYEVLNQTYNSKKFTLVAILEKKYLTNKVVALETETLKIRSLKYFAPRKHTDTMGDIRGWWRLLNELTGERHYAYFRKLYIRRWKWFIAVLKKFSSR